MADWYETGGVPGQGATGSSADMRGEFAAIQAGLSAKLPALAGQGGTIVRVNSGGTALENITVAALAALIGGDFFSVDDAVNTGVSVPVSITHTTTGTPGTGIGVGVNFVAETSPNNNEVGAAIHAISTDATLNVEDFDLAFLLMTGGSAAAELMRLKSSGELNLASGGSYQIAGADVLSGTALGPGVVSSSLTSLGTIASLVATSADINGGTIDGAAIGASSPSTGVFTTLSFTTALVGPSFSGINSNGLTLAAGMDVKVNGNSVLTETTLGSTVVNSSLTSVGTISTGVWQGTAIDQAYVNGLSGTNTGDEPNATVSVRGTVILATSAEVTTGTETTKAITPSALANADIDADTVDGKHISVLTAAAYGGLTPDADTLYFIVG